MDSMKRIVASLLMIVMLIASTASAESLVSGSYVDVPAALTQDSVLDLTVADAGEVITLPQSPESVSLLNAVYSFVRDDGNRPARYYDEETQRLTDRALSLLEPALLVVMAVFAGFIVIALYLPMFTMYAGM